MTPKHHHPSHPEHRRGPRATTLGGALALGWVGLVAAWTSAAPAAAPATQAATPASASPYPTAHDAPLRAEERLVATAEGYRQYRVEFDGIRGARVPAFLYLPTDGKPRHPAVLLQYGSGGNKGVNYIVLIAQRCVARGLAVLTIDVPGRGERHGEKGGVLSGTFVETLGDYSRAIDFLAGRPDIDAGRLGYVGISWGAITGITFAAHDQRVKVVVSLVGGGDFLSIVPGEIDAATRRAAERVDPVYHVGRIAPRPLLLVNATRDVMIPKPMADALHAAAGEGAKKVWLETDHIFSGLDRYATADMVIEFVKAGLGQAATRPAGQPSGASQPAGAAHPAGPAGGR